jgi:hypothetical protein
MLIDVALVVYVNGGGIIHTQGQARLEAHAWQKEKTVYYVCRWRMCV